MPLTSQEVDHFVDPSYVNIIPRVSNGTSIPQLLHQIGNDGDVSILEKQEALQQLVKASSNKDNFIWTKYFNQILTTVLEVLDNFDSSVREICLLLVAEMLHNQKDSMEESIEIVLEKLLHATKDDFVKVANEAHRCLNVMLAKYDPHRCLSVCPVLINEKYVPTSLPVTTSNLHFPGFSLLALHIIVPLLASDDEKTLVMIINCLTKLVGRLSQVELITQLPSFLPALFDAFSNQSPDVRKAVVFCLVDIYIMLGKAFVPYLEGLSSTQLRMQIGYHRQGPVRQCMPTNESCFVYHSKGVFGSYLLNLVPPKWFSHF